MFCKLSVHCQGPHNTNTDCNMDFNSHDSVGIAIRYRNFIAIWHFKHIAHYMSAAERQERAMRKLVLISQGNTVLKTGTLHSFLEGSTVDNGGYIHLVQKESYSIGLTIIFSKRALISFSERFMERSSKRGWGMGSSTWMDMGAGECGIRGLSFLIPVFRKLVIRSRWRGKRGWHYQCVW